VLPGVAYRIYTFLFPASLISFDPDKMAIMSQLIISNGELSELNSRFYSEAAGFQILGSVTSFATGLPVNDAYVAFPLVAGIVMPLLVGSITRHVTLSDDAALVSIALSSVAGSSLKFSVAPIPLLVASIFVVGFVVVLVVSDVRPLSRHVMLLITFLAAATIMHKLPVMLIFGGVTSYIIYTVIVARVNGSISYRLGPLIVALPFVFLIFQWVMYTQFFESALFLGLELIGNEQLLTDSTGRVNPPSAATKLSLSFYDSLLSILYLPLTVIVAALAGGLLLRRYDEDRIRVLQAFALVVIWPPGLALLSNGPSPIRLFVYGTMFCSVLVGVLYARLAESSVSLLQAGKVALVIILIVTNLTSPAVWPDSSDRHRNYLNQTEVEAKQFINDRATNTVYADPYFKFKTVDHDITSNEGKNEFKQRGIPMGDLYRNGFLYSELLNANFSGRKYETVALRTSVDIFWMIDGAYRLDWEPEVELGRTHSQVYNNGNVVVFHDAV